MRLARISLLILSLVTGASLCAEPVAEAFAAHCAGCHGLDGKARTPAGRKLGAKDLSASTLAAAEIEARILAGVTDRKGTVRMPAFQDRLSPAEVSALRAFVEAFRR